MSIASPALSLVLPAYNEARRLPPYLAAVREYLDLEYPGQYEVIVVDDGSRDGQAEVLARLGADWPALRTLCHPHNQGKGAAVRTGVLASRGRWVLFADADGATPIDQERRLREALCAGAEVAVGSRLAGGDGLRRNRHWLRGATGRWFASLAQKLLGLGVRDTQCGFKMFLGEPARRLFVDLRETGYLFDLELLAVAERQGLKIVEVPVNWQEIPGGHFRLFRALPRIALDLCRLRRRLGNTTRQRPER